MIKMIKESTVGSLGGSLSTTIPLSVRDVFGVEKGYKAIWIVEDNQKGETILTVKFKKTKKSKAE